MERNLNFEFHSKKTTQNEIQDSSQNPKIILQCLLSRVSLEECLCLSYSWLVDDHSLSARNAHLTYGGKIMQLQ